MKRVLESVRQFAAKLIQKPHAKVLLIGLPFAVLLIAWGIFNAASGTWKSSSPGKLTAPKNFVAESRNTGAKLSWDAVPDAEGYYIYRYNKSKDIYEDYQQAKALTKTLSGLKNGEEYRFKVRAYQTIKGEESYGDYSEAVSVTPYSDKIDIGLKTVILKVGATHSFDEPILNGKSVAVTWETSDASIARVGADGTVTAVANGTATVIATAKDGKTVKATIIVGREAAPPLGPIAPPRYQKIANGKYTNNVGGGTTCSLVFVGDIVNDMVLQRAAQSDGEYDFSGGFKYVKDIIEQSDLAIANLEATLSHSFPYSIEEPILFRTAQNNGPATILDALRYAGFDALMMGNNHRCDAGPTGIVETIEQCEKYGFAYTGAFADKNSSRVLYFDVNGIKIALLSYTQKTFNSRQKFFTQEQMDTMVGLYSKEKAEADIKTAKSNGAEFVIVYMHWGSQGVVTVSVDQANTATDLANAGADLILGAHPQLLQAHATIKATDGREVLVYYSLGNFYSHMKQDEANRDTLILQIDLERNNGKVTLKNHKYTPCLIFTEEGDDPYVIVPATSPYLNKYSTELNAARKRVSDIFAQ